MPTDTQPPLTEQYYKDCGGAKCPLCRSSNLTTISSADLDGDTGFQEVECLSCGATWQDRWELSGYENLAPGKKT